MDVRQRANREEPGPTPNSHEDSKEHGAAVIKQMGHLETQAHKQKNERFTGESLEKSFSSTHPADREQPQHMTDLQC